MSYQGIRTLSTRYPHILNPNSKWRHHHAISESKCFWKKEAKSWGDSKDVWQGEHRGPVWLYQLQEKFRMKGQRDTTIDPPEWLKLIMLVLSSVIKNVKQLERSCINNIIVNYFQHYRRLCFWCQLKLWCRNPNPGIYLREMKIYIH